LTTSNQKVGNVTWSHGGNNHDVCGSNLNEGISNGDKGNNYDGIVDGPTVLAHTDLAKTIRKYSAFFLLHVKP
jgi:hypothetical protein